MLTIIIIHVLVLLATALGAIRGRMFGGGVTTKIPKIGLKALEALDVALVVIGVLCITQGSFSYQDDWVVPAITFLVTLITANLGHADFFYDWGNTRKQTMTPVVKWIYAKVKGLKKVTAKDRNTFTYDTIGMGVVGLMATLPVGIAVGCFSLVTGIVIALSGVTKALAYYLGYKQLKGKLGMEYTEWGEWLTGGFRAFIRWEALALLYLHLNGLLL